VKLAIRDTPAAQPSLHEVVREEVHAAGPVPRAWLQERVRRRTGVDRDEVVATIDELLRAGDMLAGHGLVGPAPLRGVPLPGGNALLVGTRPTRFLDVAPTDELPRRVASIPPEAVEVPLDRWTGLDRAPVADQDLLDELAERDVEDDGEDWTQAYGWRDGRFRPDPAPLGLWRLRMPGGWFRYVWADAAGRRRLTTDEGLRAAFALARQAGGTSIRLERADGDVLVQLPRLPRAEYRMVAACASGREGWAWRVPSVQWPELSSVLNAQLGLRFEDSHGEA
jgi:hypothetical protein